MIVGSIKENITLEKRVSITPESAKNIIGLGLKVCIEKEYASHLGINDDEYHDHDDHGEHDDHDEHDEEAHNEFVAHYSFNCGNIKEIDRISFPYFTTFPNSGELEVQFVSEIGSTSFEVEGDEPFIDLKGKI